MNSDDKIRDYLVNMKVSAVMHAIISICPMPVNPMDDSSSRPQTLGRPEHSSLGQCYIQISLHMITYVMNYAC